MSVPVTREWWDPICGKTLTGERPEHCVCGGQLSDLGWRVGYNAATYTWHSTAQSAEAEATRRNKKLQKAS